LTGISVVQSNNCALSTFFLFIFVTILS